MLEKVPGCRNPHFSRVACCNPLFLAVLKCVCPDSLPGRAKLATNSPPDAKSGVSSGVADGSPYGLLVIWQRTQSPRPASARQTAGRTFDCDRSENGKGTRTTSPAVGVTMPRL